MTRNDTNSTKGTLSQILYRIPLIERLSRVDFSDERECRMIIQLTTCFIMALLSIFMSCVNIATSSWMLFTATAVFAVLCIFNLIAGHFGPRWITVTGVLFLIEFYVLLVFFIIAGTADGFSILWSVLLPVIAIMFFGRRNGSLCCIIMLLIFIFFFWTPIGQSFLQIEYHSPFLLRYPFFYTMICLVILFMETIRQRTILEVEKARDEANRANKAKSAFLARMSHEIRTPINAVLGMNELILRESKSPEITGYSENIYRSGTALLSVINDILDISKIESGNIELTCSDYCLAEVISDCITMVHPRLTEKNLKLEIHADEKTPAQLYGDIVRIRQIFSNILTNAVKYTNSGTITVTIGANHIEETSAEIIVSIKDTGIGIKEEDLPHIFDTFHRLDEKHTASIEGTGLGLSITRQLVELMDGSISVKSTVGVGSEFTVIIPQKITGSNCFNTCLSVSSIKAGFEHPSPAGNYAPVFVSPKTHMLAVDDVAVNLEVIKGLLKKTQIQIDTASNGFDAIELIRKNHYDIILLDDRMPGLTGTETLAKIRSEHILPKDIPVIVVTANARMGEKEKYLESGFDGYLSKPIWGFELESLLRRYIKPAKKQTPDSVSSAERVPDAQQKQTVDLLTADIPGIDQDIAKQFCENDINLYHELLTVFLSDRRILSLEKMYADKNIEDYRTEIHGLKSALNTIGAVTLAGKAAVLEVAAKEKDWIYITGHHEQTMQEYRTLLADIQTYLNGEKP